MSKSIMLGKPEIHLLWLHIPHQKEYRKLVGLANNLNQLTKMAHQDGIIYLYSPLDSLLREITNTIREYKQGTNKKKK